MPVRSNRSRQRLSDGLVYAVLAVWSLIIFFPLYWLVITAFKGPLSTNSGATFIPWVDFTPELRGWDYLFGDNRDVVMKPFLNSVVVSLSSALGALVIGSMAGYALARFPFRFGPISNDAIALTFMGVRMFPAAVLVIPLLIMYRELGLLDTRIGLIIAYWSFGIPFVVWMMRDFFRSLPVEIEESALIDGCTRLGVLRDIAFPLARPGLIAVFILLMIDAWNEYTLAVTFAFTDAVTIPLFLQQQNDLQLGTQWWNMSAIALVSLLPIVASGLVLERYITRGLTFGAIKG
jgi:multiple sugar transport system permease protein